MPTIEESVTIARSPEEVCAFLPTTENVPAFESQMTSLEPLSDFEVTVRHAL